MKYRLVIPLAIERDIARLSPNLKGKVRAALEVIRENPHLGKPLRDELKGHWSYRVVRYRIVYRIHHHRVEVQVIDMGPRNVIYERVIAAMTKEPR